MLILAQKGYEVDTKTLKVGIQLIDADKRLLTVVEVLPSKFVLENADGTRITYAYSEYDEYFRLAPKTTVKTTEQIDALKANWSKDPCWDIEATEGFEAHREELLAFRLKTEREGDKAYYQGIIDALNHANALYKAYGMSDEGNLHIAAFVGKLVLKNRLHIIEALSGSD